MVRSSRKDQEASTEIAMTRLLLPCASEFDALVAIYREAFPESERKPVEALRLMLASDRYHFLLATESGHAVGFAIARVLGTGDAVLLEYMAIAQAHRGRGLGRQIVRATALAMQAPPTTLLLEVESDRDESPERVQRTKRKHFYRSSGARELEGLRWIMPPVTAALPPPMEMLALSVAEDTIPRSQLREWIIAIYTEVYGQTASDSRIESMLAELPEAVPIQ